VGSETKKASDEQFAKLIAERNSKACKILEWKGKKISVKSSGRVTLAGVSFHEGAVEEFTVVDCDQFYVTLGKLISVPQGAAPLEAVAVSFDYPNKRLELVVREV
jgi:hypothetical protein